MTWPSFASACPMSTIWSSRARKRSFCPLFRRSFGRIESTSAKLTAEENHGQRRRSICKKSSRQTLLSCNCKDSKKPTIPRKTRRLRILHGRLKRVVAVEASDVDIYRNNFKKCSDLVEAHDPSRGRDG